MRGHYYDHRREQIDRRTGWIQYSPLPNFVCGAIKILTLVITSKYWISELSYFLWRYQYTSPCDLDHFEIGHHRRHLCFLNTFGYNSRICRCKHLQIIEVMKTAGGWPSIAKGVSFCLDYLWTRDVRKPHWSRIFQCYNTSHSCT